MRRQPLGSGPGPLAGSGYDDLGWNDMGYDVDPDQAGEPAQMVDLTPLLTGSVLAHNIEAEHAVEDSTAEPVAEPPHYAAQPITANTPLAATRPEPLGAA